LIILAADLIGEMPGETISPRLDRVDTVGEFMKIVTIHQAKTNLSKLTQKAYQGEEIIIARRSEPVVRLVPVTGIKRDRQPGALRGKLRVGPEFFDALPAQEMPGWE
jgi:prevent-host-death family protein